MKRSQQMFPTQYVADNIHANRNISEILCMNLFEDAESKFVVIPWTLHIIFDLLVKCCCRKVARLLCSSNWRPSQKGSVIRHQSQSLDSHPLPLLMRLILFQIWIYECTDYYVYHGIAKCDTVYTRSCVPTFRRNLLRPSSWYLIPRNIAISLSDHMASHFKIQWGVLQRTMLQITNATTNSFISKIRMLQRTQMLQ